MNRWIILGVVILGAIYVFFSSLFIVNERQQAIVLRFGQIIDVRSEPGIYFKIPTDIVDTVQLIEDRLLRQDLIDLRVQVSGGAFYEVDAFITYRINNPRLFREAALGSLDVVGARVNTAFAAVLRQVYGLREFNAALSEQRPQMMLEARDQIRPDVQQLGIEVVDVRILRTDLAEDVFERTYERMRAERLAEAALLRARGQEQAQSLRAIADRQAVEILAAANRDSEILRGEGDAERNATFASAYNQDPEFFLFYRSMQSYRTALSSSGTTMVLSPDSEFFRYFGSDGLASATPGVPTPGVAPFQQPELVEEPMDPSELVIETPLPDGLEPAPLPELSLEPAPLPEPALEPAVPAEPAAPAAGQ